MKLEWTQCNTEITDCSDQWSLQWRQGLCSWGTRECTIRMRIPWNARMYHGMQENSPCGGNITCQAQCYIIENHNRFLKKLNLEIFSEETTLWAVFFLFPLNQPALNLFVSTKTLHRRILEWPTSSPWPQQRNLSINSKMYWNLHIPKILPY